MHSEMEVVVMEELKPCPFCGGEAVLETHCINRHIASTVYCGNKDCICHGVNQVFTSENGAARAWNNRVERTCHNLGREEGTNYELYDFGCSTCGYCADITEPNYCPHCRAKVVN